MFIDPEPKRHTHSSMARSPSQSSMASEYYSAGRPNTANTVKRKPLAERSQSQNNRRPPSQSRDLQKPTVRLIRTASPSRSPLSSSDGNSSRVDNSSSSNIDEMHRSYHRVSDRLGSSSSLDYGAGELDATLRDSLVSSDRDISAQWRTTHEGKLYGSRPTVSLLSSSDTKEDACLRPGKAYRSSAQSIRQSLSSSTLRDGPLDWTSQRLSQGTTLRGTPTPTEQELRDQLDRDKDFAKSGAPQILETLLETSPGRPSAASVKAVSPSANGSSETESNWHAIGNDPSSPQSADFAGSDLNAAQFPETRRWTRRRGACDGSLELPANSRSSFSSPALRAQPSTDSFTNSYLRPSSPIVVVYESDSSLPGPRPHALHYTPSVESIQTRLQYPTVIQPRAFQHQVSSTSLASSLRPSSPEEVDTLPPLHIPRRRSRQQALSSARQPAITPASAPGEESEGSARPRQQVPAALGTILADVEASNGQVQLPPGALTDDAARQLSGTWPRMRRQSTVGSLADDERSLNAPGTAQSEYDGETTFASFRQISAKPPPLFKTIGGMSDDRRYEGPRPPMPPVPDVADSDDENWDTVSEMQAPSLKAKRSAYSLHRRSNSTPSKHTRQSSQLSTVEQNRRSNGSSIFPAWAKLFYSGSVGTITPSKTSLHHAASHKSLRHAQSHNSVRQLFRMGHQRAESAYTVQSNASRLGKGESMNGDASSTGGSHFLPSILRYKSRSDQDAEPEKRAVPGAVASHDRASEEVRVANTMPISVIPNTATIIIHGNGEGATEEELLPSGHPKWGTLKDEPTTRMLPPRTQGMRRGWDELASPHRRSVDQMSDYQNPRLLPSKRASQSRLSLWRPPSFAESLDSLFRSKANRQILLFAAGFICPLLWMLAAVLPVPKRPISASDLEKSIENEHNDRIQAAMMQHQAGNAEKRWREERLYLKAQWWRWLNRIMSVVGVLVIAGVISLAIIATR